MRELIPTSVVPLDTMTVGRFQLGQRLSWRDPDIGCTLVLSQPAVDPDLWAEFSLGAERSYRKHGVECALDVDALRSGADTIMFFAMIDDAGRMVGGLRAKGPLRSADDIACGRRMGGPTRPAGGPRHDHRPDSLRRPGDEGGLGNRRRGSEPFPYHRLSPQRLPHYGSPRLSVYDGHRGDTRAEPLAVFGGVVAPIPAAPYPDDRYQTKMIWWNRRDFVNHAEPQQAAKILTESQRLTQEFYGRRDKEFASQNVG